MTKTSYKFDPVIECLPCDGEGFLIPGSGPDTTPCELCDGTGKCDLSTLLEDTLKKVNYKALKCHHEENKIIGISHDELYEIIWTIEKTLDGMQDD